MKVWQWGWVLLLLASGASGSGAGAVNVDDMMGGYRQALQQQDAVMLASLIAPEARVTVTLVSAQQEMVFTLTRAQYLQQQRALWRFADKSKVTLSDIKSERRGQGVAIQFRQQARYDLFHQTLHQDGEVKLDVTLASGSPLVDSIEVRTRVW